MNNESYFYLLGKNIMTSYSAITGIGGVVLTIVFWIWKPEEKISLCFYIMSIAIIVFFLLIFIRFSIDLYSVKKQKCKVLTIRESYGNFKSEETVIALTTCEEYFSENGIVSVFHLENGFERQIALGKIINIQEDKKVQILIFDIDAEFSCDKLLKNERELLEKLRIKPIIKMTSLEEMRYGK